MRVDDQLLADAESNYEETISSLDDRAQAYADQFHGQVIVPFCDQHNLRFWSGNGVWFFEAPNGKKSFEDPEEDILRWGISTGNAELKDDPSCPSGRSWVMTCDSDDLPEFFYNYSEIHRMLNLNFMSGCLGYWINDHKPAAFPDREWEKKEKR